MSKKQTSNFKDIVYRALITNEEMLTEHPGFIINVLNGQIVIDVRIDAVAGFIENESEISLIEKCVYYKKDRGGYCFRYICRSDGGPIFKYIKLNI